MKSSLNRSVNIYTRLRPDKTMIPWLLTWEHHRKLLESATSCSENIFFVNWVQEGECVVSIWRLCLTRCHRLWRISSIDYNNGRELWLIAVIRAAAILCLGKTKKETDSFIYYAFREGSEWLSEYEQWTIDEWNREFDCSAVRSSPIYQRMHSYLWDLDPCCRNMNRVIECIV